MIDHDTDGDESPATQRSPYSVSQEIAVIASERAIDVSEVAS